MTDAERNELKKHVVALCEFIQYFAIDKDYNDDTELADDIFNDIVVNGFYEDTLTPKRIKLLQKYYKQFEFDTRSRFAEPLLFDLLYKEN